MRRSLEKPRSYALFENAHWSLTPSFHGSNPCSPAKGLNRKIWAFFALSLVVPKGMGCLSRIFPVEDSAFKRLYLI